MNSHFNLEFMHAYLQWNTGNYKANTTQIASPVYYLRSKKKVELTWTERHTLKPVLIGPPLPEIS